MKNYFLCSLFGSSFAQYTRFYLRVGRNKRTKVKWMVTAYHFGNDEYDDSAYDNSNILENANHQVKLKIVVDDYSCYERQNQKILTNKNHTKKTTIANLTSIR